MGICVSAEQKEREREAVSAYHLTLAIHEKQEQDQFDNENRRFLGPDDYCPICRMIHQKHEASFYRGVCSCY